METIEEFDNSDTISVDTLLLLEQLENRVQEKREAEIAHLNSLTSKVRYIHTSMLFYRKSTTRGGFCLDAYNAMVKHMSDSDLWRDVGYALGITQTDLNYINNSKNRYDAADVILKVLAQNEEATLDKILEVFIKLKNYALLTALEKPLTNLVESFNKNDRDKKDSGYHSGEKEEKEEKNNSKEIISYKTEALAEVPPALIKKYTERKLPKRPNEPILIPSTKVPDLKSNNKPIMFLTFAEDGFDTACLVKSYVDNWTGMPEVTVLTLEDVKDEVFQKPETFIREYFEKADLVIPIVTSKYLEEIKCHKPVPKSTDNLDCKYVNFIYNLIVNTYIHANGCLNKKVRSVLPQECPVDVLRSMTMYPELMPWTFENNFDKNFKVFLTRLLNCRSIKAS